MGKPKPAVYQLRQDIAEHLDAIVGMCDALLGKINGLVGMA